MLNLSEWLKRQCQDTNRELLKDTRERVLIFVLHKKAPLMGGGVVWWGTKQPGMKKVLLGESEVLTPVKDIIKIKFVQNMDKS